MDSIYIYIYTLLEIEIWWEICIFASVLVNKLRIGCQPTGESTFEYLYIIYGSPVVRSYHIYIHSLH